MPRVPELEKLLGLWRGDEDSTGYIHEGLAREICAKLKPVNIEVFLRNLSPDADPDEDVREMAERVFANWRAFRSKK